MRYIEENNVSAVRPFWNDLAAWAASTQPGKPFVISETGAGGIYEWGTNATAAKWTLKYQGLVIAEDVAEAIENNNISGITLWHWTDFKGNDGAQRDGPCDYVEGVYPPICAFIDVTQNRPGPRQRPMALILAHRPKLPCRASETECHPSISAVSLERDSWPIETRTLLGGENHKGVLDFWRREKPAFDAVAAQYNATKAKAAVV